MVGPDWPRIGAKRSREYGKRIFEDNAIFTNNSIRVMVAYGIFWVLAQVGAGSNR
jgi:hypothetical protein